MNTASKNNNSLPVIVLCGPTAVGKSEVLYSLLRPEFEIINADSLQVYKYLDIGSAKPSQAQLAACKHYLIDFLPPTSPFNAGDFVRHTERFVKLIHANHGIPVISGGTAFYLKSFLCGLPELPGHTGSLRRELEEEAAAAGCQPLYLQLQKVDPLYAAKISPNDRLRIIRALEVYRSTGRPLSTFPLPTAIRTDLPLLLIGLQRPREELNRRIDERVEKMFAAGLVEEIKGLLRRGYTAQTPGMQGIGYKEFFAMQQYSYTLAHVKQLIRLHTRRYAKRQMTFFKSLPGILWFHPDEQAQLTEFITEFLAHPQADRININRECI